MNKFFLLCLMCFSASVYADGQKNVYETKDFSYLLGKTKFNDDLLKMHFALYAGYVKNTNLILSELDQLSDQNKGRNFDYGAIKRRLAFEYDGMKFHELYFENLTAVSNTTEAKKLVLDIVKQFGSFEKWRADFINTAMIRGIGWTVLCRDKSGRLLNIWISEHQSGLLPESTVLLVMDVWEHAYITQYGLEREKYIETFFSSVNWSVVQQRYDAK
ncbi:MAG: superoxide dismutase [Chlamydiae bacterium]|nr:superoxide dismutase [Chlamydiota bacterium]